MPSSVGWRISSPYTQSKEESGEEESAPQDDEAEVPQEAEVTVLINGAPHEDEEQAHEEAERDVEKEAEAQSDVEILGVDAREHEIVGVDGRIKSEAQFVEVETAEITSSSPESRTRFRYQFLQYPDFHRFVSAVATSMVWRCSIHNCLTSSSQSSSLDIGTSDFPSDTSAVPVECNELRLCTGQPWEAHS